MSAKWEVASDFIGPLKVLTIDDDCQVIALVGDANFAQAQANAHLIAAAPDLLEALTWQTNLCAGVSKDGSNDVSQAEYNECHEAAVAAIAKAEGR